VQATFSSLNLKYEQQGDFHVMSHGCKPREEVLVVSVGGEGTTSFIDMLRRGGLACNHIWDGDGLKHRFGLFLVFSLFLLIYNACVFNNHFILHSIFIRLLLYIANDGIAYAGSQGK
jgi:hypothetical protein